MSIERMFNGFNLSAMGMTLQRKRMSVIAENLANIETTRTSDGTYYKRKIVVPRANLEGGFLGFLRNAQAQLSITHSNHIPFSPIEHTSKSMDDDGLLVEVVEDTTAAHLEYDPTHPDANKDGYVEMPSINVVNEMTDMLSASRTFEANVVAINAAKNMAKDSLEI
jgi:flagellar basal-body rod protein FlgC